VNRHCRISGVFRSAVVPNVSVCCIPKDATKMAVDAMHVQFGNDVVIRLLVGWNTVRCLRSGTVERL